MSKKTGNRVKISTKGVVFQGDLQQQALDWINAVLKKNVDSFEKLMKGDILCRVVNKIRPGTVKRINRMNASYFKMENIDHFLNGCRVIGVADHDLFVTVDFFEQRKFNMVAHTVLHLGVAARAFPDFKGPYPGGAGSDSKSKVPQVNETEAARKQAAVEELDEAEERRVRAISRANIDEDAIRRKEEEALLQAQAKRKEKEDRRVAEQERHLKIKQKEMELKLKEMEMATKQAEMAKLAAQEEARLLKLKKQQKLEKAKQSQKSAEDKQKEKELRQREAALAKEKETLRLEHERLRLLSQEQNKAREEEKQMRAALQHQYQDQLDTLKAEMERKLYKKQLEHESELAKRHADIQAEKLHAEKRLSEYQKELAMAKEEAEKTKTAAQREADMRENHLKAKLEDLMAENALANTAELQKLRSQLQGVQEEQLKAKSQAQLDKDKAIKQLEAKMAKERNQMRINMMRETERARMQAEQEALAASRRQMEETKAEMKRKVLRADKSF
ncbi:hypothetical protein AAMO2058_001197400 [Amorphochlora amoebiformis]